MKMMFFVAAWLAGSLLGGCASTRSSFDSAQLIPVDIRPTSPVSVSRAEAVRGDAGVSISGKLKRPHRVQPGGHVDVLFLGSDGSPLVEKAVRVAGIHSKRRGLQEIRFTAEFDLDLPEGASAVFSYHAPPF